MPKRPEYGKMPLESAFYIRTSHILAGMKSRFKEKKFKRGPREGHTFRVGREIPFTLNELRDWLLKQLGGNVNGTTKCAYCTAPLDAMNVSADHMEPASQGGSLGLENLTPCCDECQRLKGRLTLRTFQVLMAWLNKAGTDPKYMTTMDRMDIIKRLKGGGIFYKTRKEKPVAQAPVPVQEEVF